RLRQFMQFRPNRPNCHHHRIRIHSYSPQERIFGPCSYQTHSPVISQQTQKRFWIQTVSSSSKSKSPSSSKIKGDSSSEIPASAFRRKRASSKISTFTLGVIDLSPNSELPLMKKRSRCE